MSVRRGNLQPAHRGYWYQDIATAYTLVRAIVERYDEVIIDRKVVADDRLDDLEVRAAGRRLRRQFKSSQDPARPLSVSDFTGAASSIRIDRLVLTHVRAGRKPADEYRLCATWMPPLAADPLIAVLGPTTAAPTLAGWVGRCFQLNGEAIWPAGGAPIWPPLGDFTDPAAEFGRVEFLEFCRRFVIELELPGASLELAAPGPLERALVEELTERVGIGRYPNHGRAPSDVASLAIALATLARTNEASLAPSDIERDLEIRLDFGRVAQAFPLDAALFHDRPSFRRTVHDAALVGMHQLVQAPPGAGKSWELTRLAEELTTAGAIVARHYCYLEPGDALVERRVTTDVFFANLLGDLLDADPSLRGAGGARYAAGLEELEATLLQATATGRPVVLIVDGIDHIARVRGNARTLADDETDIVERLATARLPEGVALVIGSQPGRHLDPLRVRWGDVLAEREVPPWQPPDLAALADRHGVSRGLAAVGVTAADDLASVRDALAERAEGNPLYARYLSRGLVAGLKDGSVTSPHEWIATAPAISGDVAVYYAHLYRSASVQAQAVADVLGVIDFAVTEAELRAIVGPLVGGWVQHALPQLTAIVTDTTGQGGVRIFHESFRRFMTEELSRQGRAPAEILAPVIEWLTARGFYADAKAYRFLLPALRRADRGDEVLAHVDVAFVSESVAQAHPPDAVQRNLSLAADIAAESRDWPALARCVELHRAAYTCFDEAQNQWLDYWATYLSLFGPAALAERLLFDGRPTLSLSDGLHACALVDDAGATAPWREYLALYDMDDDDDERSSVMSDPEGSLKPEDAISLTVVHGRIRMGECVRVVARLLEYLRTVGDAFHPLLIRRLGARLARTMDPELVERIAQRADPRRRGGARMTPRAAAALYLGIADERARVGDAAAARVAATSALSCADTIELAAACLDHAAGSVASQVTADPSSLPIAVGPDVHLHEAKNVRAWVAAVRLSAADPERGPATLAAELLRVEGAGWYRCWLRFVLALAKADVARGAGQEADVRGAFHELTRDVHPFRGTPRACDLWAIRLVIQESLEWGMRLLRTEADWKDALAALTLAADETSSRIDREDGGPLGTGTVLDVLLPHVTDPVGGAFVEATVEQVMARLESVGSYYPTHAEYAMRLARVRHAAGNAHGAREAWARGAVFLGGYGWRKDVTIFDIVEGASGLVAHSREASLQALADSQPLVHAAVSHTDGRSTKHAPNAWLRALIEVHAAVGTLVLARTLMEEDDQSSWPNVRAVQDAIETVDDTGDPALLDAVLATLRFEADDRQEATKRVDARLAPVVRVLSLDRSLGIDTFRRAAAEVAGDSRRDVETAAARLAEVALAHEVPIPEVVPASHAMRGSSETAAQESRAQVPLRPGEPARLPWLRLPPFASDATFVELLSGLRRARDARRWDEVGAWDDVVLALGYHLGQLVDAGREDDVRRLLRFWARDAAPLGSGRAHPLGALASGLDAAGYASLAATAYALAYTASRGGNGYHRLGDKTHGYLIDRAVALEPARAHQVVADEVAFAVRGNWYSSGTTHHLVERLAAWGEPVAAEAAWREAFAVVRHRLPLAPQNGWFAPLRDDREPGWPGDEWSVDEGLVALLLARISDPTLAQKVNALDGVVRAIARRPDAVPVPLRWFLTRNAPLTSVLLVLDALQNSEAPPYPITRAIAEVLRGYATCDLWGARRLATALLSRAGLPVAAAPQSVHSHEFRAGEEMLSADRRQALLRIDVGGVVDGMAAIWPELPEHLTRRLQALLARADVVDRARGRYRIAHGRDGDAYPPTPTLMWERELFEVALHEVLSGLGSHLWKSGQWSSGLEDAVLRHVLPESQLHLALAASRTARPAWPAAEEVTGGAGVLPTVGDDDPLYTGWTRIALLERRYRPDRQSPYRSPVEAITVLAGVVAVPLGMSIPADAVPFVEGDAEEWWSPKSLPPSFPARLPFGPIVGLAHVVDWLGDARVLVPPAAFFGYLGLESATPGGPLIWRDAQGYPAVALRTWWVRNPEALFAQPAACEGADLLIRPDLLERIRVAYGVPVHELRTVRRHPIVSNRGTR